MSETMTTFKFFWGHEDEKQEDWLRAMAQQGLHLVKVNPLCFWTFRRGEPADIVYRVDFPTASRDTAFRQLMEDAGWDLAATTVGWHYWRTPAVGRKAPELFSDKASKLKNFKDRLAVFVACAMPALVLFIMTDKQNVLEQLSMPSLVLMGGVWLLWLLVVPYSILRLMLRIRTLQASPAA